MKYAQLERNKLKYAFGEIISASILFLGIGAFLFPFYFNVFQPYFNLAIQYQLISNINEYLMVDAFYFNYISMYFYLISI
jgi:hypothetical protein